LTTSPKKHMKTQKPYFAFIKQHINAAHRIIIAGHTGPDFDSVGSCLALYEVLRAMRKGVVIASDFHESIWREVAMDKLPNQVKMSSLALYKPDVVFLLDYGKKEKIDASVLWLIEQTKPFVITIDHHEYQSQFGDIVWVDSAFVSTTEMLHMLFSKIKARIPEQANYYLLLGVWGDTGAFACQRASKRLLRMVNALVTQGDEIQRIMELLHQKMDADEFRLYGKLLASISYDASLGLGVCKIRTQIPEGMNRTVMYEMKRIKGLRVALFLKRFAKTGYWKASVWGAQHNVLDLNEFARRFGGGGHFNAAGFKTKLSGAKIIQMVKQAMRENCVSS